MQKPTGSFVGLITRISLTLACISGSSLYAEVEVSPFYIDGQYQYAAVSCGDYADKAVAQANTLRKTYHLSGNKACAVGPGERWTSLEGQYLGWCQGLAEDKRREMFSRETSVRAKKLLACFNTIYPQSRAATTPKYLEYNENHLGSLANRATEDNEDNAVTKLKLAYAYGAPVDWRDYLMNSETAVDIAARNVYLKASEFLLGIGSNADAIYDSRVHALDQIIRGNSRNPKKYAVLKLYLSHFKGRPDFLYSALAENDLKATRMLLEYGANPDADYQRLGHDYRFELGFDNFSSLELPLYTAARKGNMELAKLLLLHKADPYNDPRARKVRGYEQLGPPLYAAVKSENYEMVKLLVQVPPQRGVPIKLLIPSLTITSAVQQGCTSVGAPKHMEPGTILHLLIKRGVELSDAQKRCVEW